MINQPMTVKHMFSCGSVHYWATGHISKVVASPHPEGDVIEQVVFTSSDGADCSLTQGVVFIINGAGKTIDKIELTRD